MVEDRYTKLRVAAEAAVQKVPADQLAAHLARRGLLEDILHARARERCLNDATGQGYEHHLMLVAAEHGAAAVLLYLTA